MRPLTRPRLAQLVTLAGVFGLYAVTIIQGVYFFTGLVPILENADRPKDDMISSLNQIGAVLGMAVLPKWWDVLLLLAASVFANGIYLHFFAVAESPKAAWKRRVNRIAKMNRVDVPVDSLGDDGGSMSQELLDGDEGRATS